MAWFVNKLFCIALIWCAHIASASAALVTEHRPHWLDSKLRFSGASAQTRETFRGNVGVEANSLIFAGHTMGVRFYNDSVPKADRHRDLLRLQYSFPLEGARVQLNLSDRGHQDAETSNGARVSEAVQRRSMALLVTRPLMSAGGIRFNSTIKHFARSSDEFQSGAWDSSTTERRSSMGLQAVGEGQVLSLFSLQTRVDAQVGTEYEATRASERRDESNVSYRKLAVSSSLSRELTNWRVSLDGHYQFSEEPLPDSEQVTVASSSLLTGFAGNSLSADEGGWLKLGAQSPSFMVPYVADVRTNFRLATLRGWVPDTDGQLGQSARATAYEASLFLRSASFDASLTVGKMFEADGGSFAVPKSPDVSLSLHIDL